MKTRLIALGLAVCLTLGLAACTGGQSAQQTPDPSQNVEAVAPTLSPDVTAAPDQDLPDPGPEDVTPTPAPSVLPDKGTPPPEFSSPTPPVTHHPEGAGDLHHSDTPSCTTPVPAAPSPTPAVTLHPEEHDNREVHPSEDPYCTLPVAPTPTAAPTSAPATPAPAAPPRDEPTAQEVYAAISAAVGGLGDVMDASFVVENFYDVDADDMADFCFYMPTLSATVTEVFIAKAAPGELDDVVEACQERHADMKAAGAQYAANAALVEGGKLVTKGNWVLFCVCQNAGQAVSTFQSIIP